MKSVDAKRKFLIATSATNDIEKVSGFIQKHISNAQLYSAKDGSEALSKAKNDPPHVLIVDRNLAKISGIEVAQAVLNDRTLGEVAIILISEIPDREHFVDEVVTGKVQLLHDLANELLFTKALARALNYVSHGEKAEFFLKFLAKGDILIKEGDKADNVYVVRHGNLQAFTKTNGKEIVLGTIEEGQFVGEMAYINGEPRSASVVALEDCELIEFPIEHLDHVLFQKPAWSKALFKTLSRRVTIANNLKRASNQDR